MRLHGLALASCATVLIAFVPLPARAGDAGDFSTKPGAVVLAAQETAAPPELPEPQPFAPVDVDPDAAGFRYPVVFLVPLALLVLGGMLARTLTRPIPSRR